MCGCQYLLMPISVTYLIINQLLDYVDGVGKQMGKSQQQQKHKNRLSDSLKCTIRTFLKSVCKLNTP